MSTITDQQITEYVEAHIGTFHDKRLDSVRGSCVQSGQSLVEESLQLIEQISSTELRDSSRKMPNLEFLRGNAVWTSSRLHDLRGTSVRSANPADLIDRSFSRPGPFIVIKSGPNLG